LVAGSIPSKNSIENHFDTSFELEAMLEKRVKRQLLEEVQSIWRRYIR
jgi:UTP--glucose-1-phosphate uridylyltransferase